MLILSPSPCSGVAIFRQGCELEGCEGGTDNSGDEGGSSEDQGEIPGRQGRRSGEWVGVAGDEWAWKRGRIKTCNKMERNGTDEQNEQNITESKGTTLL